MYNVALIGCGAMGQNHLDALYLREDVCLFGVCDYYLDKAQAVAQRYNAKHAVTDYRILTRHLEVDIVIIATYPSSHLEILQDSLANQKHVICEKPITQTLEEGQEFVRLVKENRHCKVLVGHILRHNETYQYVADLILKGTIGFPVVMRMSQNHRSVDWQRDLRLLEETSPIIDCGVHYLDVMQWFTGEEVVHVQGVGSRTHPDVPKGKYNYGLIQVTLSGGSVAFYEAGWGHTFVDNHTKEFIGPKGRINIVYQKHRSTHKERGNLVEIYRLSEKATEMVNVPFDKKPTGEQFDHLLRMIEENVQATPTIDQVYEAFAFAVQAEEDIQANLTP